MRKKVFIIIFYIFITLPIIFHIISVILDTDIDVKLVDNSGIKYEKPLFNGKKFFNGSFQLEYENWWNNNFMLHGFMTKTYNQIRYDVFSLSERIIGKNHNIFEESYINEYLGLDGNADYNIEENRQMMDLYLSNLEELNDKLNSIGKKLMVYTTPSKCDYMSDDIPYKYHLKANSNTLRAIDYFNSNIKDTSICYIDSVKTIEESNITTPIFYHSGIHWSRPAEQIVTNEILNQLSVLLNKEIKRVELSDLEMQTTPYWRDSDVLDLTNIWNKPEEIYYQFKEEMVLPLNYKPFNILLQGGSFASGLRKSLIDNNIVNDIQYINYANAIFDKKDNITLISNQDWDKIDLSYLLDKTDVIIIEINEEYLRYYSNNFTNYLNDFLDNYIPNDRKSIIQNFDLSGNYQQEKEFFYGIYEYENGFAWTKPYASILIQNENIKENGLEIDLAIPEFWTVDNITDNVLIYVNGSKVSEISPTLIEEHKIIIQDNWIKNADDSEFLIEIYCPTSFIPSEIGLNTDQRELGLRLIYLGEVR